MSKKQKGGVSKKYVLIGAGIFLLFIPSVMAIMTYFPSPTDDALETTESNSFEQKLPAQVTVVPTDEIMPSIKWTTYQGTGFEFQYPPEWTAKTYMIGDQGYAVIIKPNALPEGINYPQFVLQVQKSTPNGLQNKEGFLQGLSMQKSEVMVGKDKAIQYKGTIPFKTVGATTVKEPLQDTTTLLEKNGQLFVFKYEYEGSSPNGSLDDYFNDFIRSFKVTE